jgi:putative transposase
MKKHTIRREFLKLKNKGLSYKQCQTELENKFRVKKSIRTLKRWTKRLLEDYEWDLKDSSKRPSKLSIKFSEEEREIVTQIRKRFDYGSKKIRIQSQKEGIYMSISTVKRVIKQTGLSKGSKMEGMILKPKWVRFERPDPNYLWQIDGDENDNGTWRVPVEDECSRYCLGVFTLEHNTTEEMIRILEILITIHGKPKQILTDNGSEFGGPKGWDSDFDK